MEYLTISSMIDRFRVSVTKRKDALIETDPASYITEYTLVYEDQIWHSIQVEAGPP